MGAIVRTSDARRIDLEADGVVGRAEGCWPRFDEDYVSTQHARVRWYVDGWQVKDLGSKNGTFVNGVRLTTDWHDLAVNDQLSFGHEELVCILVDDSNPVPLLFPVDEGEPFRIEGAIGAVPPDQAGASIFCDASGSWWLEQSAASAVKLRHREPFEVDGKRWYLSFQAAAPTARIVGLPLRTEDAVLTLAHSLNEEHVALQAKTPRGTIDLGERQHNYVMLVLARARLADRERGLPETACGWVASEALADQLKISREQLNLQIFRIRKQFDLAGFEGPASVIQRRTSTHELRIGFRSLSILRG